MLNNSFAGFLYKVRRRLRYLCKNLKLRVSFRISGSLAQPLMSTATEYLWSETSVALENPIEHSNFDKNSSSKSSLLLAQYCISHKLKIFSDNATDISFRNGSVIKKLHRLLRDFPADTIDSYKPIDWHTDFNSGYTWDSKNVYIDSKIAPKVGVEIKIPWEVSRFQHIGSLAFAPKGVREKEFVLQVLDWIISNPYKQGVNWLSAHEVSIRTVNWIWGLRVFGSELEHHKDAIKVIKQSLFNHGCYIDENLDYYIECTDDHYLSNLTALLYLGAYFPEFPKSREWTLFAIREIESEMRRQVLDDGYSHMMSSNYHKFVTELFALCSVAIESLPISVKRDFERKKGRSRSIDAEECMGARGSKARDRLVLSDYFYTKLNKMANILAILTKPNELLSQFGDNDSSEALIFFPNDSERNNRQLFVVALVGQITNDRLLMEIGSDYLDEAKFYSGNVFAFSEESIKPAYSNETLLPDAGIAVLRNERAYLAVTCGNNGRGELGGHGHNDKLSFELNVNGSDFIVDGGCPYYTSHVDLRNEFRSTFSHNTISVQGKEQDDIPLGLQGLFSLPGNSCPSISLQDPNSIVGSHHGYGLPHKRIFSLEASSLRVFDSLKTELNQVKQIRFNLGPKIVCVIDREVEFTTHCTLTSAGGIKVQLRVSGVKSAYVQPGFYSSGFGRPVENCMLCFDCVEEETETYISWE